MRSGRHHHANLGVAPGGRAQRQHSEVWRCGGHLADDVDVGVVAGASVRLRCGSEKIRAQSE